MKSFEEMQKCWNVEKNIPNQAISLNDTTLASLIRSGIRKEQKMVWEYCVASGFWQWLVYAALTHFIIRFWGDWQFMIACFAVILLYIPFTIIFLRKFRYMRILNFNKSALLSQDIYTSLKTQYQKLNEFFIFKKRFDWLNVPVCCLIIVAILFKYNMVPSIRENVLPSLIVFLIYVVLFIVAIYVENKKRFITPLQKLKEVIHQMEVPV